MRIHSLLAFALLWGLALGANAAPEQARSADAFVDSIGVCTHWTYADTPYGFLYPQVRKRLAESGIRHVRDGFNPHLTELARLGIHTCLVADFPNGTDGSLADISKIVAQVKDANRTVPYIDSVEGPNEPDFFWDSGKKTYQGNGYRQGQPGIAKGVIAFQHDLYHALKSDPATKKLTVIGPALGKTYDPGGGFPNPFPPGSLADAADWGNFHPYPGGNPFSLRFAYDGIEWYIGHGNQPSGNLDEFPYAFSTYAPPYKPLPMAATETGYSTDVNGSGITELVQAKYLPRLYCEYFRVGIQRTFTYEFADEFADPEHKNREANFGLLRRDGTPKPAYFAVKNLIVLLSDKSEGAAFRPGTLNYTMSVSPAPSYDRTQYVHHLLLQKRSGAFYLALWHEIADEDASHSPHRALSPPALRVTLTLPPSIKRATLFSPGTGLQGLPITLSHSTLALSVPDQVILLRLG